MQPIDVSQLVVFHGDLNQNLAHVYVRLSVAGATNLRLRGHVRGPRSALTRTLPASIPLSDLGPGPTALARALVPDPCFWEPGQPFLYDVDVEVCHDDRVVGALHQTLGLRRLGIQGGQLLWESRPWVLLGCHDASVETSSWHAWRAERMARVVRDPAEHLCRQASEEGVVLIAQLAAATHDGLQQEIHRVGKWASVALIEVPTPPPAMADVRTRAPNVLWAERVSEPVPPTLSDWADLGIGDVSARGVSRQLPGTTTIPWIALRRLSSPAPLVEAARQCRAWYAELSENGPCLGCLV
jgi:hypothetical protein